MIIRFKKPLDLQKLPFQVSPCQLLAAKVPIKKDLKPTLFSKQTIKSVWKTANPLLSEGLLKLRISKIDIPINNTTEVPVSKSDLIKATTDYVQAIVANNGKIPKEGQVPPSYSRIKALSMFLKDLAGKLMNLEDNNEIEMVVSKLKVDARFLVDQMEFIKIQAEKMARIMIASAEKIQVLKEEKKQALDEANNPKKMTFIEVCKTIIKYSIPIGLVGIAETWIGFIKTGITDANQWLLDLAEKMPYAGRIIFSIGIILFSVGVLFGVYSIYNNRKDRKKERISDNYQKKIDKSRKRSDSACSAFLAYVSYRTDNEMAKTGYLLEARRELPDKYFAYAYTGNYDRLDRIYNSYRKQALSPSPLRMLCLKAAALIFPSMRQRLKFIQATLEETQFSALSNEPEAK
jgi:hypothetical protein